MRDHEGNNIIPGMAIERYIFEVLPMYINGLNNVGVTPPLIIMFTLEGVQGARYIVSNNIFFEDSRPIDRPILYLPECILNDFGEVVDYHRNVKPAIDALWNATGRSHARFFNADGLWVGEGAR